MDTPLGILPETGVLATLAAFLTAKEVCAWTAVERAWRVGLPYWRKYWAALRLGRAWRLHNVSLWASHVFEDCQRRHVRPVKVHSSQKDGVHTRKEHSRRSPFFFHSTPRCPYCWELTVNAAAYFAVGDTMRGSTPHLLFGCHVCIKDYLRENVRLWVHDVYHEPQVTFLCKYRDGLLAGPYDRGLAINQSLLWEDYENFLTPSPSASEDGESGEESDFLYFEGATARLLEEP